MRPRKMKLVGFNPGVTYFKPQGVPMRGLEEIELNIEELETLRLNDLKELSQVDAAKEMDIHQSTFQRTLARAREKVSDALVNGKSLKINGGRYSFAQGWQKRRRGNISVKRVCICPGCGHEQGHIRGVPCDQTECEKCGSKMIPK